MHRWHPYSSKPFGISIMNTRCIFISIIDHYILENRSIILNFILYVFEARYIWKPSDHISSVWKHSQELQMGIWKECPKFMDLKSPAISEIINKSYLQNETLSVDDKVGHFYDSDGTTSKPGVREALMAVIHCDMIIHIWRSIVSTHTYTLLWEILRGGKMEVFIHNISKKNSSW